MSKNIDISDAAPSHIAASTTWPLPDFEASSMRGQHADHEIERAAAEIADQVERRHRLLLGADRGKRAGDRDVVDVMAGGVAPAGLPGPSRSCGHRPALDCARARRRGRGRAAPSRRGESLRSARRHRRAGRAPARSRPCPSDRARSTLRPRPATAFRFLPAPTRSSVTTSAPMSASIMQANGPGPMPANSTMRKPASGPEARVADWAAGLSSTLFSLPE